MAPYDIAVVQGETFSRSITWLTPPATHNGPPGPPVDLTGARVEFQWRVTSGPPIVDYDSDNLTAGLTLDAPLGPEGVVAFSVSDELTAAMSFGQAAWDVFVTAAGGTRKQLFAGSVKLVRAVTRP